VPSRQSRTARKAVKKRNKVFRRGQTMTAQTRAAAQAAVERRVHNFDRKLIPVIQELRRAGVTSLRRIGWALESRGIQAPRGGSKWSTSQVARLLARLEAAPGNKRHKLRVAAKTYEVISIFLHTGDCAR
jgi:hypothetical protein